MNSDNGAALRRPIEARTVRLGERWEACWLTHRYGPLSRIREQRAASKNEVLR